MEIKVHFHIAKCKEPSLKYTTSKDQLNCVTNATFWPNITVSSVSNILHLRPARIEPNITWVTEIRTRVQCFEVFINKKWRIQKSLGHHFNV